MRADDLIFDLLQLSMQHANDATDPDTPESHFRHHCAQSVVAAQAAYVLDRLKVHGGDREADCTAAEMREFGQDSEVLISWVGEQLNKRAGA